MPQKRKQIDLDTEVIKSLIKLSADAEAPSLKSFMETVLTEKAKEIKGGLPNG